MEIKFYDLEQLFIIPVTAVKTIDAYLPSTFM